MFRFMLLPFGMAFTTPNRTTTMTRFWLTLITVVLMFALPMFAPAEHRGLVAMTVWALGLAVVSYLGYPQPKAADGRDKIIEGLTVQVGMLESALDTETANGRSMTLALGDDPRIEVVYGCALIDRTASPGTRGTPRLTGHQTTQNPDVLTRWVREGRKTWANTALRTSDGSLYFLREGAPVNLITNLVR